MNIIVLGAGVVGTHLTEILSARGHDLTVVEQDAKKISLLADKIDVNCLTGDVQNVKTLSLAGVVGADLLLAVTSNDATNLLTASLAKQLGAKKVVARVRNKNLIEGWQNSHRNWFQIDLVLSPEDLTANELAKRIGSAGFYVPETLSHSNVALQEWTIADESPFVNRSLREISQYAHVIIACIFRDNQIIIPSGNEQLKLKDRFFMVGARPDIQKVAARLHSGSTGCRNIMIFGLTFFKLLSRGQQHLSLILHS